MTNHMRYAFEKMNSVTALSIGTSGQMLLDTMKASGASERFLRAAASLPAAGYLGWQIAFGGGDPAADHSGAGVVFAGPGVKLTGEDLSWIFRDVVTADGNPEAILEDLWESGRSVYRILPEPVSIGQERQSSYVVYQQGETEVRPKLVHFEEMSAMLVKAGAVIRIVAGADPEDPSGCGMVFLSCRRRCRCGCDAYCPWHFIIRRSRRSRGRRGPGKKGTPGR